MKGDPSAPGEGERVYYMMALRHLLPLALGLHHVRLPEADVMSADMQADDLAGLECWFVQVRRDSDPSSGVQDAVSQVAGDFMARRGVFERSASASGILPADMFCFVDHRVYEDEADELAVLGGPVNRTGFHGGQTERSGECRVGRFRRLLVARRSRFGSRCGASRRRGCLRRRGGSCGCRELGHGR